MNKNFRLSVTTPTHHKIKKLVKQAGHQCFYNLICLWAYTASNKPNGRLTNMDIKDIEFVSDWSGEPGTLVKILINLRFINFENKEYSIHNWLKYNPLPIWPTQGKRPCTKTWIKIKKRIFKRDNYKCQYCGQYVEKPECDHINPICNGGSNSPDNLTTSCSTCNRQKGTKALEDWLS